MRFAGIDIASETHVLAVVNAEGAVELRPIPFGEDAAGYQKVLDLLSTPGEVLIAMEATGHYWKNLFAALAAAGHNVALINPLRTHRFASEDLERTKTDAIDALGIARFAAQKRPPPTRLPDAATEELRELVRLRERLLQDFGDRVRQLHRLVDLGFPEFTRYVRTLHSELASAILHDYPTAAAFHGVSVQRLAKLRYDGHHQVGAELARALIEAAQRSVGRHHAAAYRLQVRYACEDLDILRRRLRQLDRDLGGLEARTRCGEALLAHDLGHALGTRDMLGHPRPVEMLETRGLRGGREVGAEVVIPLGTLVLECSPGRRDFIG